jgi:Protein of unknown function (DUF1553)/Protein of unknown function (DUF1549)/Planctomycete cytochrome C
MMCLRPSAVVVILSVSGLGVIEPASIAQGSDPARANDATILSATEQQFFEKQVRPLFIKRCYQCHSSQAKVLKGGLHLDSRGGWMKGGDSGTAVVPGAPDESLLIRAIRYQSLQMPPRGKLSEAEIAVLERWVRIGAPDPRVDPTRDRPRADHDAVRSHWAFQPIAEPPLPRVKDVAWPRSGVDCFILAKLESEGLTPVTDADRPVLLRRVFFDLVGVPPTPAEIESFLADDAPDAFGRMVDALLGRPDFGERWGRHWLDVARYADSNGSDENFTYYDAWRYRNYVLGAFNGDKPFARFLTEQLAGDLLPFRSQQERDDNIVATGFLVVGPKVIGATDKQQLLVDVIDEQLDTIGKAFLGLTIGCARCHDHKFDPISARDYYALAGILASTETIHGNLLNRRDLTGWNLHPLGSGGQATYDSFLAHEKSLDGRIKEQKRLQEKRAALKQGVKTAEEPKAGESKPEANVDPKIELQRIEERLATLKQEISKQREAPAPRPPLAMSVNDHEHPGPTRICIRGDAHNRGETVPRGFISIVEPRPPEIGPDVSGRAQMAEWLTSDRNPLTSRVAVNRVWQHLFGQGLVGTPDDFGTRGERPSNPELLDHLARRFMHQGWSVKRLIRHVVLSRTYQLGSNFSSEAAARDPENRWLWRMNRRRLQAEALRDSLLAVSGQLDLSPAESVVAHLNVQATGVGVKPNRQVRSVRRTIYLPVVRNDLPSLFQLFDFGDALSVNGRRSTTNVAPQALFMMNSPLILEAANRTAASVLAGRNVPEEHQMLQRLYMLILGRPPRPDEIEPALALVHETVSESAVPGSAFKASATARAWTVLSHALFCSTGFLYLD